MVASLAILAVVVVAGGAAMRLAASVTTGAGAARTAAGGQAADAADLIAADLSVATNFTERTPSAVTFTVPGRASAAFDTLRYSWSGPPAYSLTRQTNGAPPAEVARDVRQFSLAWLTRAAAPPAAATDKVLLSNDGAPGATNDDWQPANANNWGCQTFAVALPAGTKSWGITRVRLMLKADANPDGVIRFQVRTAAADHRPSAVVLDSATYFEVQSATAYAYADVPFTHLQNLTPAQAAGGLSLVFSATYGGGVPIALQQQTRASAILANAWRCDSTNAGAAWGVPTGKVCLRFFVYGTTR